MFEIFDDGHAQPTTHISVYLPPRCFLQRSQEQDRSHGTVVNIIILSRASIEYQCHAFPLLRSNAHILRLPFELQSLADIVINIVLIIIIIKGERKAQRVLASGFALQADRIHFGLDQRSGANALLPCLRTNSSTCFQSPASVCCAQASPAEGAFELPMRERWRSR